MDKFYVAAVCQNCDTENYKIEVKSRIASLDLVRFLEKNSADTCQQCGKEGLTFNDIEIVTEDTNMSPLKKEMKEVLLEFIEESNEKIILKEHSNKRRNKGEVNHFSLITKEKEREYEYYGKLFGNVGTIYVKSKRENTFIVIGTNEYSKRATRELAKRYKVRNIGDNYDQIDAPEWHISFEIDSPKEMVRFLKTAREFKTKFPYDEEEIGSFVLSVQDISHKNEEYNTHIMIMEKEDWDLFKEFMPEYQHGYTREIEELKEKLELRGYYESQFQSSLNVNTIKEEFLKYAKFEWNEEFHQFATEYRQNYEE